VVQVVGRATVGRLKDFRERLHPNATYSEKDISPYLWPNGTLPTSDDYRRRQTGNWRDYSLRIEGLVGNSVTLIYDQFRALPKHEKIT
jgi:sulfoxide reductase catalytic subunit YedY